VSKKHVFPRILVKMTADIKPCQLCSSSARFVCALLLNRFSAGLNETYWPIAADFPACTCPTRKIIHNSTV
jgi:hypothetical protein